MGIVYLVVLLMFMCICITNSYYINGDLDPTNGNSVTYKYDRMDEVMRQCGFVLDSASELKPNDNRLISIKEELSFVNGDWWQDSIGAPLMPFDDRDIPKNPSNFPSPLKLASFWVTDVDRVRRSEKSIRVSGLLQMGITVDGLFMDKPAEGNPHFDIWPSQSVLRVTFQGIYTEPKGSTGERVMCLLGETMLPSRDTDSTDPWGWVKTSGYTNQPPLLQDDQILLVINYPKILSLTTQTIQGSMKSLNLKSSLKYFDEVHISSWLGSSSNYAFSHEKVVSKACDPYPYEDSMLSGSGGIDVYKGPEFCSILEHFTRGEAMTVVPNWKCNGTDEYCSRFGPFVSDKEIEATDGGFKDVKLVMQNVRCEKETLHDNSVSIMVSAVFRAVPPFENQFSAAQRTGLSNMTLASEGIWKSSAGQLCMVGCIGFDVCDTRICLYIPLLFSIKRQNVIMGTISNIKNTSSYFPLSFEKLARPAEMTDQYTASHVHYEYSKLDLAGAVLERNKEFSFGTVFKRSLLKFPKLEDTETFLVSLSLLSEDLSLHTSAFPDPMPRSITQKTDIQIEIVSIGPLFGRYWQKQNSSVQEEVPYHPKAEYSEKQLLMNVSAQIKLSEKPPYGNITIFFVEGLYDPLVGKMYLIGCRDVRASWKTLFESMDLEAGLDCLVEVIISYPPTTARWLVNPTAGISISSQRNEDDPLYFKPMNLQTLPIMYRKQREDILSRRGVEGILRVLTLSVASGCIFSQLVYIRSNLDSVPFISIVSLGVQALGYSLPLITGAEALFKRGPSESYETPSFELDQSQWIHVVEYAVKLLVLVAFLLILRICQNVWKSRIRLLTRAPLEPRRVPSEKRVLISTVIVHMIGYAIVLSRTGTFLRWQTELEEYSGLVQDFFLLPQIIGNLLWQIDCKPLGKLYYMGVTAVRLLPHMYDFVKSPIPNPYFSEEYEFVNPRMDFYSKFGDVAIPVTAVFLAILVYVQQRWNYEKLRQCKFLPFGSKVYERLPSQAFEAELASGVNENSSHTKEHAEEG